MERVRLDHITLSAEIRGDGPAVLLVHGFPLDHQLWRHQLDGLDGYRCIAPDLRGAGHSDAPETGYSMTAYAADLVALLDALHVTRAALIGLSMGGYIAFELVRRSRERITGLVLMDTRAEPDTPEARAARDAMIASARERGAFGVAEAMLPRLVSEDTLRQRPEVVAEVRGMMERAPLAGIIGALEALKARPDSRPLLPTLAGMPVLGMVGEGDVITPPSVMREMVAAIPGAELSVVPRAGHVPPLERPAEVTGRIASFLSRL